MSDDFFIDDILSSGEGKKRKNSGRKGKDGERQLCKLFTERFPDYDPFIRVIGSGALVVRGQTVIGEQARQFLTSDIVCPPGFRYSVESKYGYAEIELTGAFIKGNKQLDEFLSQATKDAGRVNKLPMLCWKKPRHCWLTFQQVPIPVATPYLMYYRDWIVVALEQLLLLPDDFFFPQLAPHGL